MKHTSRWHSLLAALAVTALSVYILACRPAFSPDGSQVIYPALDPQTTNYSIVRYNRVTKTTDTLFTVATPKDKESLILSPQWMPDGKRVVIAMGDADDKSDTILVTVLPLDTKQPTRILWVEGAKKASISLMVGPPLLNGCLYFGGEGIRRLNLETGEIRSSEHEKEIYVQNYKAQLYYIGNSDEDSDPIEVGRVNPDTLECSPLVTLKKEEYGEVGAFIGFSPDGSRLALTSTKENQQSLIIIAGKTVERTLPLGLDKDALRLGNLQWAADGKSIYAASSRSLADKDQFELGITEVSLEQKPLRHTGLVKSNKEKAEELPPYFQIVLSPDGKTLAVSSAYPMQEQHGVENVAEDFDRALFLVDMTSPQRTVTRVRLPAPPVQPNK
jgi:hypothetical protein